MNFSGFQAKPQENGKLAISLFIRNGHSQHITLDQLPLEVTDATGDLVARGSFTLDSLEVKANTSKALDVYLPCRNDSETTSRLLSLDRSSSTTSIITNSDDICHRDFFVSGIQH